MKEEPILKPTAILRVINLPKNLQKEHSRTTTQQSIETSELEKLLMQSKPSIYTAPNHRKLEEMPSATLCCTLPRKVHVAIQCVTQTKDIATNFKSRKTTTKTELQPFQEISRSPSTISTPSLFGCTSTTEEISVEECPKEKMYRNLTVEIVYRKPKMYLGLPKQYLWLINYIVEKNNSKIEPLCLVITLLKIKQNDSLERISDQFEISRTKLSEMIRQGIEILGNFLQNLVVCPQPEQIKRNLPTVFKIRYSNVQMIIDCFEIQISKPSDPLKQAQTWSQYKNSNTIKYLIGCTPNGLVSFISQGYGGRISDKALVEKSNLLNVLKPNSVVLADRGFKEIESLLNSHGIKLLRPPSVYAGVKQTLAETLQSKVIASLRVHVERVIRRLREFSMLKPHSVVTYKYVPYMDEIEIICCGLINLQGEIIKKQD